MNLISLCFLFLCQTSLSSSCLHLCNVTHTELRGAPPSSLRPSLEAQAPEVQSPTAPVLLGGPGTMENEKEKNEENSGFVCRVRSGKAMIRRVRFCFRTHTHI